MRSHTIKPRLIRLRYFVWLVVPLAVVATTHSYGLPQFRWSYSWIDQGQGYNPHAHRYYTRCTYIGFQGATTIYPSHGRCAWVRLHKSETSFKTP